MHRHGRFSLSLPWMISICLSIIESSLHHFFANFFLKIPNGCMAAYAHFKPRSLVACMRNIILNCNFVKRISFAQRSVWLQIICAVFLRCFYHLTQHENYSHYSALLQRENLVFLDH